MVLVYKSIQEEMEKHMKAERERRATILLAEGEKQAKILEAQGYQESQISRAEGEKQAAILKAQGEAEAIEKIKTALGSENDYTVEIAKVYEHPNTMNKYAKIDVLRFFLSFVLNQS